MCAKGAGGVASTKEVRVVPMRLGNETVFAEVLILNNDVPLLLPVTLLDRCIIDLQRNVIVWNWANKKPCETEMLSLKSKHRSVDITNFSEVVFSVPQGVLSKYGVLASDFIYQAASPVAGNCYFSNRNGASGAAASPRLDGDLRLPEDDRRGQRPRVRHDGRSGVSDWGEGYRGGAGSQVHFWTGPDNAGSHRSAFTGGHQCPVSESPCLLRRHFDVP